MLEGKMMPRFMLLRPADGKANNQDAESQQKSRKHGEFGLGYADIMGFPGGAGGKEPACAYAGDIKERWVRSLGGEDPWRRAW